MVTVVFESLDGRHVSADAAEGARVVDLCDDLDAPVPFSCRGASCGTCRVDVLEGAALLASPRDDELDVLDLFGDDPNRRRLACQARLGPGSGRLRLRAVDDGSPLTRAPG